MREALSIGCSGSSPHTRGTGACPGARRDRGRFIPAHAGNRLGTLATRRASSVHPRTRGEQRFASPRTKVNSGSSPHTRGTEVFSARSCRTLRFIPAHAGNRCQPNRQGSAPPVHPRTRGEQPSTRSAVSSPSGSSPHTRGTALSVAWLPSQRRFIPAHAGNRTGRWREQGISAVHPRTRGEQSVSTTSSDNDTGSSPHTRGTVFERVVISVMTRFIPAHAGNRPAHSMASARWPVHPRTRGEQSRVVGLKLTFTGSSPHTRGTDAAEADDVGDSRFIPAHAGNSAALAPRKFAGPVHPRTRGEQSSFSPSNDAAIGSSPHTRGTVVFAEGLIDRIRFIPAHAGNSPAARTAMACASVHPRTRGEQMCRALVAYPHGGSSPHTRGTDTERPLPADHDRFIPAHAGNSSRQAASQWLTSVHPRTRGEQ